MNEWMNKMIVNGWMDELMNEYLNEWMNEQDDSEWMNG